MTSVRIIPCLDVKDGRVVKGVNFVDLVDAGDAAMNAVQYEHEGADEIVFLDITATYRGENTVADMVSRVAEKLFIPFTVGGGVRSVDDMRGILRAGADKVGVNSAAVKRPELISEGAELFGSQCVVLAVDAKRRPDGGWTVYTAGGRHDEGIDAALSLDFPALRAGKVRRRRKDIPHPIEGNVPQKQFRSRLCGGFCGSSEQRIPLRTEHCALDGKADQSFYGTRKHPALFFHGDCGDKAAELSDFPVILARGVVMKGKSQL